MHVCGVSASAFWNEECFGQTAVQNVLDRQLYRMFWTDSCTENQNTFMLNDTFFQNYAVCDKYGRTGRATGDNMAHAHCMLDT